MMATFVLSGRDPQGMQGVIKIKHRDIAECVLESWKASGFTEVALSEAAEDAGRYGQHVTASATKPAR
jgi:hypothetical protein